LIDHATLKEHQIIFEKKDKKRKNYFDKGIQALVVKREAMLKCLHRLNRPDLSEKLSYEVDK
jgi:hypothetical protein